MEKFSRKLQIRWSDIDQNRHMRHSVYYDYGAMVRVDFLSSHGLTSQKMEELRIGPVLFREEAIFKREIRLEDEIEIDFEMVKCSPDFSRWSLRHRFTKKDGTLAAIINIDGAWIDIDKRKLTVVNHFVQDVFDAIPKAHDFERVVKTQSPAN